MLRLTLVLELFLSMYARHASVLRPSMFMAQLPQMPSLQLRLNVSVGSCAVHKRVHTRRCSALYTICTTTTARGPVQCKFVAIDVHCTCPASEGERWEPVQWKQAKDISTTPCLAITETSPLIRVQALWKGAHWKLVHMRFQHCCCVPLSDTHAVHVYCL